jgi:hypothetical protein
MDFKLALLVVGPDWFDVVLKNGSPDVLAKYDAGQAWVESLQRRDTS